MVRTQHSPYLNLHIEHSVRVDRDAEVGLDVLRKTLLVRLLDRDPLLLEQRVVDVLQEALELEQVAQPHFLLNAERLRDQLAEARVALVEPAARGDCMRFISA